MKLRLPILIIVVALIAAFGAIQSAFAEGLQWSIPGGIGTVQLPGQFSDIMPLVGYDFVQKQAITGASASILTLWKDINGYVGAVGEWQTQAPNLQPYLAIGSDFAKYVPGINQVKSLQIHAFVRYVASTDKHLGAGGAVAYRF